MKGGVINAYIYYSLETEDFLWKGYYTPLKRHKKCQLFDF
mgnify:CR=1 FL=1